MAYDQGLVERIREYLDNKVEVVERKMFGGLAFMTRAYMFVGVVDDRLMVRVGPENYAHALTKPHVYLMDFTGKPMTGYVYVNEQGFESDAALHQWIQVALNFVNGLPEK